MIREAFARLGRWVRGLFGGGRKGRRRGGGSYKEALDTMNAEASQGPRAMATATHYFSDREWQHRKSRMRMVNLSRRGNRTA